MLRKIAKFFLWFFGIIGLLIIGFFIYLYIAFSPPFGCDPELRNDACDLKNWGYERKFSNTKANPFPQNLTPKPIFLEASNVWFPTSIEPAYVYIADEHGVWLRYNDGLSQDYFLGKDMPKQYYLYSEDDFSPSEEVRKKEKFYAHKAWNITLKDGESEIYKQTAHKITRQYIGSFDLHSQPGRTVWFPSNILGNLATISKLQTPLNDTFPHTINRYTEITPEKNG